MPDVKTDPALPLKILIVDDDDAVRRLILTVVDGEGYVSLGAEEPVPHSNFSTSIRCHLYC
jgi:CheY-like chemotaxis protein